MECETYLLIHWLSDMYEPTNTYVRLWQAMRLNHNWDKIVSNADKRPYIQICFWEFTWKIKWHVYTMQ